MVQGRILAQDKLITLYKKWLTGLMRFQNSLLDAYIIHPKVLMASVHRLIEKLELQTAQLKPLQIRSQLHKYYSLNLAKAVIMQDALIISVTVPLMEMYIPWNIFAIRNRIGTNMVSEKSGITRVHSMHISDYLAVSNDNTMFMHMSYEEAARCMYVQQVLCVIHTYMTNQAFSCITAIYMDNVATIKSLCDFQVWPNAQLAPAVYPLDTGQYMIHNMESPLQILCKTGSKQITVNVENVVNMLCGCKFDTMMFKSLTSLYTCNEHIETEISELLP